MKPVFHIIFSIVLLTGCASEMLEKNFDDFPIVESYLFVGKTVTVKVSRLTTFDPSAAFSDDDINNLTIEFFSEDESILLTPQGGEGIYTGPENFLVQENTDYKLRFNFNGKEVGAVAKALSKPSDYTQSTTSIVAKPFTGGTSAGGGQDLPEPVELSWANPENDYYLVLVENIEENPTQIGSVEGMQPPPTIFRNEPYQTSSTRIGNRQFQYYGAHRLVLFHVTPEYASLFKETGTTSQNITTPPSNIVNGLGIFTALHSDTLFLEVVPE